MPSEFERGLFVGVLIGEGHFGGDGRQPHVTLRMHVRHKALFRWIERTFPGGKLYGPYHHGGRDYFQWMARGTYLRDQLMPILERYLSPELDEHAWRRLEQMRTRYPKELGAVLKESSDPSGQTAVEEPSEEPESEQASPLGTSAAGHIEELFQNLRRTWPGEGWEGG